MKLIDFSDNKKLIKEFIQFEYDLYDQCKYWIPPLRLDLLDLLEIHKHPFHKHAEVRYFMVKNGENRILGRIAAIYNRAHNEYHEENSGFFGFFHCLDIPEAAEILFKAAEKWLIDNFQVDRIRGPFNFSTNETCGVKVDSFDKEPFIMMPYNYPYYENLIKSCGYEKEKDLLVYYLDHETVPERLEKLSDYIVKKQKIKYRKGNIKKIDEEIKIFIDIYNRAWGRNWGFVPMTDLEIQHLKDNLKMIINPEMFYFAFIDDEPAGFFVALPNINEILKKIPNGKLFPTGIFKLLFGMKKIKTFRLITLGIVDKFRNKGIDVLFYYLSIKGAIELTGKAEGEMGWILEDNEAMINPIKKIGGKIDKTYRIFKKEIEKS